jgi:hypothetical protein
MFSLVQKSANAQIVKFHVVNGEEIVGSIAVEPEEVSNLLRCWNGPKTRSSSKPKMSVSNVLAKAFKPKAVNRQFILRGCL